MKSTLNIEVEQDNLLEYLEKLEELMKTERKEMVNTLTRELVGFPFSPMGGYIAPNMSKYNPYLYQTGQDSKYWVGKSDNKLTSIEVLYTGVDINKFYGGDTPKGVWWEFATEATASLPPKWRRLERDYAYFQETGKDEVADSKYARRKGAIRRGIKVAEMPIHLEAKDYFNRILHLRQGRHTTAGKRSTSSIFSGTNGVR